MKRIITLMLAAGLLLGGAFVTTSSAAELQVGGNWRFSFGWYDNNLWKKGGDNDDRFSAIQQIRPTFKYITDENLSATLQLEIGKGNFGRDGWALGNDGYNVKVQYGYVDWVLPSCQELKIRMGMLPFALPSMVGNHMVYNSDVAGVVLNYNYGDSLGLTLAWTRPENDNINAAHDTVDTFSLAGTFKGDGFKVAPWVMYAAIGNNLGNARGADRGASNIQALYSGMPYDSAVGIECGHGFWLGLGAEFTMIDPLRVALDFAYGSVDRGSLNGFDDERKGWAVDLLAQYKLDFVTPGLQFWYASGVDKDGDDKRLPFIDQDCGNIASGFGDTGFGKEQSMFAEEVFGGGIWGIQARFDNINYGVEGLSHDFRVLFGKGTNHKDMAGIGIYRDSDVPYLTTSDKVWHVSLDTKYQIYKNLNAVLTLSYMKVDLDEDVWFGGNEPDTWDGSKWAATVMMQYKF